MITLSGRLKALEDWIDCTVLADVGCDHGYLCCQAVLDHRAERAYACDIAPLPLESARKTIAENGLKDRILPVLSDGLQNVPADVEQAVMAGMGGLNMIDILRQAVCLPPVLLLSPHKDAPLLRRWLLEHGYGIVKEKIVADEGHWYPILLARKQKENGAVSQADLEYGIGLEDSQDARDFLENRIAFWKATALKMPAERRQKAEMALSLAQEKLQSLQPDPEGLSEPDSLQKLKEDKH